MLSMTGRSGRARAIVLAAFLPFCGRTNEGSSESHFLTDCSESCAPGLSCLCGACTKPCSNEAACSALSSDASCIPQASSALCGPSPGGPSICDVGCSQDSDCKTIGEGHACVAGRCRNAESCDQRAALATRLVRNAVEQADRACAVDDDCVLANASSDCVPGCGVPVSAGGSDEIGDVLTSLSDGVCHGFAADGCSVTSLPCLPVVPRCSQGRCVDERDIPASTGGAPGNGGSSDAGGAASAGGSSGNGGSSANATAGGTSALGRAGSPSAVGTTTEGGMGGEGGHQETGPEIGLQPNGTVIAWHRRATEEVGVTAFFRRETHYTRCSGGQTLGNCYLTDRSRCTTPAGEQVYVSAGTLTVGIAESEFRFVIEPSADPSNVYNATAPEKVTLSGYETFEFSAAGDAVPAFSFSLSVPGPIVVTAPSVDSSGEIHAKTSEDLTLQFDASGPSAQISAYLSGPLELSCFAAVEEGTLVIPAEALDAIGAGSRISLSTSFSGQRFASEWMFYYSASLDVLTEGGQVATIVVE